MSLNQKYTWKNFLKEHPEFKEKKVKRTSNEAKKAFEAAFKSKMKEVLKDRLVRIEKETKRTSEKKTVLVGQIKEAKKAYRKKVLQKKIGVAEKYLARLSKMAEKTKLSQKNF